MSDRPGRPSPPDRQGQSKGIQSVEVGYRVLLAIQRGPTPIQLAEVARRAGLSAGATHNYLASLVRTGLVEQEGRGLYRLGPSAFALSLASFEQLEGYDILRREARTLHQITGESIGVTVWSQGGPVSVFTLRADKHGLFEFRTGLISMLDTGAGIVFAALLDPEQTREVIARELEAAGKDDGDPMPFIERARAQVLPHGYAFYDRMDHNFGYGALAAPVFADDRVAYTLSVIGSARELDPATDRRHMEALLDGAQRATLLLRGTRPDRRVAPVERREQLPTR